MWQNKRDREIERRAKGFTLVHCELQTWKFNRIKCDAFEQAWSRVNVDSNGVRKRCQSKLRKRTGINTHTHTKALSQSTMNNGIKSASNTNWNGTVRLQQFCWSGYFHCLVFVSQDFFICIQVSVGDCNLCIVDCGDFTLMSTVHS